MKSSSTLLAPIAALVAVTTGCGTKPQTAEEFRKAVLGALAGEMETFDGECPFGAVAETFH